MDFPTSSPLQALVRKLEAHVVISPDDQHALLSIPYKLRTLEAQSYMTREGSRAERCSILLSGYAFRYKLTGDGSRQIVSLHIPGDALDFQNMFLELSDHNVQLLTRADVAEVSHRSLEELALARPAIAQAIMVSTLIEASIFREWVLNIGRRDSRSRISHLLCEFAFRLTARGLKPANGDIELPMTQEQLADATGLTPVHVNRVLKGLQSEGLIERDRRVISFPDWERLRDVADFNPSYLHPLERPLFAG